MRTRVALTLRLLGILLLAALFLASWAASMSLPHSKPLWLISEVFLLAVFVWSATNTLRQRRLRKGRRS